MNFVGVDIAFLGASSISSNTGVIQWEPTVPVTDGDTDVEPFGPSAVYQALGFASLPFQKTDDGYAECVILRNCGGRNVVCLGGRDTRTARIVGNMDPGDTVVHSTGPEQAAQLQLKETKRQSLIVSKDSLGNTMMALLDGANDKVQITAFGGMIEMDKDSGGLSLVAPDGTGILLQGGNIHFMGTPMLGAGNPSGLCFMLGPQTGQPPGPAAVLLLPCLGVAPGT